MKALVLLGGGSKGAFQIQVLKKLLQENPGLDYDIFMGISVGALNASFLATGTLSETLPGLENVWLNEVKGNHSIWRHSIIKILIAFVISALVFCSAAFIFYILSFSTLLVLILGFFSVLSAILAITFFMTKIFPGNIYDNTPLRKIIQKNLDLEKLKSSNKKLLVGAVSYNTGKYKVVDESSENIIDWIMASAAFPIFFPMQKIDGEFWMDGGIREVSALNSCIRAGAKQIDVIMTTPARFSGFNDERILAQINRIIDIMTRELFINDVHLYGEQGIKIRVFCPKHNMKTNSLNFSPENIKKIMNSEYVIVYEND